MLRVLFILLLFVWQLQVFAGSRKPIGDTLHPDTARISFIPSFGIDVQNLITFPARWEKKQWIAFSGTAFALTACYIKDEQIQEVFRKNQTVSLNRFSKNFAEPLGSGLYTFPLIAGFGIHGLITRNPRSQSVFLNTTKAYALSSILVTLIKYSCHRHRPYEDDPSNAYLWEGPSLSAAHKSFSSGHALTASTLLCSVAHAYPDHKVIPVLCYSLAATAALSRVYDNKHWSTDVLFSAVLGWGISKMVFNNPWNRQRLKSHSKKSVT